MSSWDISYIFGEYSNQPYVSDSVFGPGVERGEEVVFVVRCDDGRVLPDLNEEFIDEAEPSYVAQSNPHMDDPKEEPPPPEFLSQHYHHLICLQHRFYTPDLQLQRPRRCLMAAVGKGDLVFGWPSSDYGFDFRFEV
ncbi:hypothetical protein L1987_10910 [Smallanthus sonchifolius]|uniref:Uncharacterized protein n=1 Tax=Smallanthus sonchifolius TaxID=185202 RepID=A0ACB9JBK7_9ASTR|nr:hypothetical protein L1987_10910 [Smallanthus sonchifolius]